MIKRRMMLRSVLPFANGKALAEGGMTMVIKPNTEGGPCWPSSLAALSREPVPVELC